MIASRAAGIRSRLRVEQLEARTVPSAAQFHDPVDFHPMIVAGDPNGSPADSPSARVDPNTTNSPFAGVGSVQVNTRRGTYIGSATPVSGNHIVTAAHVVDISGDGKVNQKDQILSVYFILNFGGNQTHTIAVSAINVHPDFTGFARPSVNDDIAVLTLATPLPTGVPTYALPTADLAAGTTLTMVGYGRSGDGVNGYTTNASFTIKRKGENNADAFYTQDDSGRPAANEVFRFDFDGPTGNGSFGGPTLGNDRETQLGGGDSGGPSFVWDAGAGYVLAGVNTFTQGSTAPRFGSLGGGINVFPYVGWIGSVMAGSTSSPGSGGGQGNGSGGNPSTLLAHAGATLAWPPPADPAPVPAAAPDARPEPRETDETVGVEFLGAVPVESEPDAAGAAPVLAVTTPHADFVGGEILPVDPLA
jgi:hypothetical protein